MKSDGVGSLLAVSSTKSATGVAGIWPERTRDTMIEMASASSCVPGSPRQSALLEQEILEGVAPASRVFRFCFKLERQGFSQAERLLHAKHPHFRTLNVKNVRQQALSRILRPLEQTQVFRGT